MANRCQERPGRRAIARRRSPEAKVAARRHIPPGPETWVARRTSQEDPQRAGGWGL